MFLVSLVPLLQLTTPLSQATMNDSGHQDVPCHLMALDGRSLGREYSGIPLLAYVIIFGVASQCSSGLSNEGIRTMQAVPCHQKEKATRPWTPEISI